MVVFYFAAEMEVVSGKITDGAVSFAIFLVVTGILPAMYWWRKGMGWKDELDNEIKNRTSRGLYRLKDVE